jgi:hypothetical protein
LAAIFGADAHLKDCVGLPFVDYLKHRPPVRGAAEMA